MKAENAQPFGEHAVFLLDTSLSEHPDGFAVNMKLLRKILETRCRHQALQHPDVQRRRLAGSSRGAWLDNTKEGRDQAFGRLDGIVLEGATDLSAALEQLVKPGFDVAAGTPLNLFLLSDGQITWGESDVNSLVARFEEPLPVPDALSLLPHRARGR